MPKALVLHAGFHKTGTSSVQQILKQNRPLLKPHVAIRLKPQMKPLLQATRAFSTWRDPVSLAKVETRFAELLGALPGMPRRALCLSAEELSGHMPGRGDLVDYSAAPVLLGTMAGVARDLFPGLTVTFALSLRNPDTWIQSAWAEHVKSSSLTLDFDTFAMAYPHAADFDPILAELRALGAGDVHAYNIEDFAAAPAHPVLGLCGVPDGVLGQMTSLSPRNTRLPDAVLLELLEANRAYADRTARQEAKEVILAKAQT